MDTLPPTSSPKPATTTAVTNGAQDGVDEADPTSTRGDAIRAKMLRLQTKIETLRKEAKEADRLAAASLLRRKLLTRAKTVSGGFLLKIPAAMWTDELRAAFRLGRATCRSGDKEAWSVLVADLEKSWSVKSDDEKAGTAPEHSSLESGPKQLMPPKQPSAAPVTDLVVEASQPPKPGEAPADAISQSPSTEVPPPDTVVSQSEDSPSSVDISPAATPAPDPAPALSAVSPEPSLPSPGLDAILPSHGGALHPRTGGDERPAVTEHAEPMHKAVTAPQFFKMTYKERQALMLARHPVLLQLAEKDISDLEYANEQKKIRTTRDEMRKAQP